MPGFRKPMSREEHLKAIEEKRTAHRIKYKFYKEQKFGAGEKAEEAKQHVLDMLEPGSQELEKLEKEYKKRYPDHPLPELRLDD